MATNSRASEAPVRALLDGLNIIVRAQKGLSLAQFTNLREYYVPHILPESRQYLVSMSLEDPSNPTFSIEGMLDAIVAKGKRTNYEKMSN